MSFINIEDLQAEYATRPNTQGSERREVTNEELTEVLIEQACEFLCSRKPNDDSTDTQRVVYALAKSTEKTGFEKVVRNQLESIASRMAAARQADDNDAQATVHNACTYFLQFVRRVQSQVARSSFFLKRRAERRELAAEHPNGDRRMTKEPYDGFASMVLDSDQITEVTEGVYDSLTNVYAFALQFANRWAQGNLGDLPYATANINGDYVDVPDASTLAQILENNMPSIPTVKDSASVLGIKL